jgi:hypothetical protein
MFAEINQLTLKDRDAELYRAAARQGQIRIAVQAARAAKARRNEGRGDGDPVVPRRWGIRRRPRETAAGRC